MKKTFELLNKQSYSKLDTDEMLCKISNRPFPLWQSE